MKMSSHTGLHFFRINTSIIILYQARQHIFFRFPRAEMTTVIVELFSLYIVSHIQTYILLTNWDFSSHEKQNAQQVEDD